MRERSWDTGKKVEIEPQGDAQRQTDRKRDRDRQTKI